MGKDWGLLWGRREVGEIWRGAGRSRLPSGGNFG